MKMEIPRMSDDRLRQFVDDFCSSRIFTSAQLSVNQPVGTIFMPLVFGAFDLPEGSKPLEPAKPEEPVPPEPLEPIDADTLYQIEWGDIEGAQEFAEYEVRKEEHDRKCKEHELELERYVLKCDGYQRDYEEWTDICIGLGEEWTQDLGVIWENMNTAGPVSVNGYPVFYSFHMMHKEDWARALKAIKREEERRKSIEL